MNIFEQEDLIKGLPDQSLMQEAQRPSGPLPQYLIVSGDTEKTGHEEKVFSTG